MNDGKKWGFEIHPIGGFREKPYTQSVLCPRCAMRVLPFGYPGALSRVDNKTEICSECGQEEALLQWAGNVLGGTNTWPIMHISIAANP
jgi:hypothetical protein